MTRTTDSRASAAEDAPPEAEFTPPSYILKAKSPPTETPLDTALEQANAVLAELAKQYPELAQEKITELEAEAARGVSAAPRALFAIAHDLRGQGGTFGFPLVTDIAASLCTLLEEQERIDDTLSEAIQVHIDSLKLVLGEPIRGDGGAQGAELLAGLRKVSLVAGPANQ